MILTLITFAVGAGVGLVVSRWVDIQESVAVIMHRLDSPHTVERFSRNLYKLQYYYLGNTYTILLPIRRGPPSILKVVDRGGFDVTNAVKEFLGPHEDSHQKVVQITPAMLGYPLLRIYTRNGECTTFCEDEPIHA